MELVLIMAVMAILATIVLVINFGLKNRQELESSVNSLAAVIRDAQQKSIIQEEMGKWGVFLENDTNIPKSNYASIKNNKGNIVAKYLLPSFLEFDPSNLNALGGGRYEREVIFAPVDGVPEDGGNVIIKIRFINDVATARQIAISSNGTVSY